jgi:hypothetical protein
MATGLSMETTMTTNLSALNARAMLGISEPWVKPGPIRATLEADTLLSALLPSIEKAHHELSTAQRAMGQVEARLQEIITELGELDALHDRLARALFYGLEYAINATDDPSRAQACERARTQLQPEGLRIVNVSYLETAGNASMVENRMTPEIRAILASIHVDGTTLLDIAERWISTAKHMGKFVKERAILSGETDDSGVSAAKLRSLRIAWIRAVRALETNIEFSQLDDPARRQLFAVLQHAQSPRRPAGPATEPQLDADAPLH